MFFVLSVVQSGRPSSFIDDWENDEETEESFSGFYFFNNQIVKIHDRREEDVSTSHRRFHYRGTVSTVTNSQQSRTHRTNVTLWCLYKKVLPSVISPGRPGRMSQLLMNVRCFRAWFKDGRRRTSRTSKCSWLTNSSILIQCGLQTTTNRIWSWASWQNRCGPRIIMPNIFRGLQLVALKQLNAGSQTWVTTDTLMGGRNVGNSPHLIQYVSCGPNDTS